MSLRRVLLDRWCNAIVVRGTLARHPAFAEVLVDLRAVAPARIAPAAATAILEPDPVAGIDGHACELRRRHLTFALDGGLPFVAARAPDPDAGARRLATAVESPGPALVPVAHVAHGDR